MNYTHMFCPIPGRSAITGIFSGLSWLEGPTPETISSCGDRNCILSISIEVKPRDKRHLQFPLKDYFFIG